LRQHGIPYEEVDIDRDPEAEALVLRYNAGRRRVPTIQIGDRFYGNPPLALLGELLGVRS
jgi:mycoredoxin